MLGGEQDGEVGLFPVSALSHGRNWESSASISCLPKYGHEVSQFINLKMENARESLQLFSEGKSTKDEL